MGRNNTVATFSICHILCRVLFNWRGYLCVMIHGKFISNCHQTIHWLSLLYARLDWQFPLISNKTWHKFRIILIQMKQGLCQHKQYIDPCSLCKCIYNGLSECVNQCPSPEGYLLTTGFGLDLI